MQALLVPHSVLNPVNILLLRLSWRKKDSNRKASEEVKRTVVCCGSENGRLNMTDLKQMQTAFLLQWVGSLFQGQVLDKWNRIPEKKEKYLCFFSNLKRHSFKGLQLTTSHLWNCVQNVARLSTFLCPCQLCYGKTAIFSIEEMYSWLRIRLVKNTACKTH